MRLLCTLSLLAMPLALAACKTTVEDDDSRVSVESGDYNDGNHCPPGHAKKGWC